MTSIPCDVVLLPSKQISDLSVSESQKLKQFGSLFVLENGKLYPHISLYMLQLKTKDLETATNLLSEIARKTAVQEVHAYRYYQALGYIDAEYQKTPELTALQNEVIKALNPVRDGMREKDKTRSTRAKGLAQTNIQKYGYQSVGDLFRPHVTITRLKANNQVALEALGDIRDFNGNFLKLGLFEMGDNGTAVRKIADFELLG